MHTGPHRAKHLWTAMLRGWGRYGESGKTCIHVLKHKHILTKVWDCKRGNLNTYLGPYRGTHICVQLCKGVHIDVGSQVDLHSCTDVCTHSSLSLFWKKGLFIADYIRQSAVYQVKCKHVYVLKSKFWSAITISLV